MHTYLHIVHVLLIFVGFFFFSSCYNEGKKTEEQIKSYSKEYIKDVVKSLYNGNAGGLSHQEYICCNDTISFYTLKPQISEEDIMVSDSVEVVKNGEVFLYSKVYAKYKNKDITFFVNFKKDPQNKEQRQTEGIENTEGHASLIDCAGLMRDCKKNAKKLTPKDGDAYMFAIDKQKYNAKKIIHDFISSSKAKGEVDRSIYKINRKYSSIDVDSLNNDIPKIVSLHSIPNFNTIYTDKHENYYNLNQATIKVSLGNYSFYIKDNKIIDSYGVALYRMTNHVNSTCFFNHVKNWESKELTDKELLKAVDCEVKSVYELAKTCRRAYLNDTHIEPAAILLLEYYFNVPFPYCVFLDFD